MDDEVFEQLRWDGAAAIPSNFREKISNVAFFIKDKPTGGSAVEVTLGTKYDDAWSVSGCATGGAWDSLSRSLN